jgi:hypothetical protein
LLELQGSGIEKAHFERDMSELWRTSGRRDNSVEVQGHLYHQPSCASRDAGTSRILEVNVCCLEQKATSNLIDNERVDGQIKTMKAKAWS